jgi:hypothetical protein
LLAGSCAGFADQPACDAEVYDYSATTADVAAPLTMPNLVPHVDVGIVLE